MSDASNEETSVDNTANELIHQQAFGDVFREARESAGYSIADVSESLKLAQEIIKALENSQIDLLPAATFTQGYIRSYARFLKLPADDIVQAYNKLVPVEEPVLTSTKGEPAQSSSHDLIVKLFSFGLIAAVIVMLVIWLLKSDFTLPTDIIEQSTETSIDQPVQQNNDVIYDDRMSLNTAEQIYEQEIEIQDPPALTDDVSNEIPNTMQQDTDGVDAAVDEKPSVIAEPATENITSLVSGDDLLVLSTRSESWTEVQDANGNRLFFQLIKQGEKHQLKGVAPFRVFLGNAPSVSLRVNEQDVNISDFIRQNKIAHVSIEANANVKTTRRFNRQTEPQQESNVTIQQTDDSSRGIMFNDNQ